MFPRFNTITFGKHSIKYLGPNLWRKRASCRRLIRARINDSHRRLNYYNDKIQQRLDKLKQLLPTTLLSTIQERPLTALRMLTEIDKCKRKIRKSDLAGHLKENKCESECTLCIALKSFLLCTECFKSSFRFFLRLNFTDYEKYKYVKTQVCYLLFI